jgi:uracil DNA glycosylase
MFQMALEILEDNSEYACHGYKLSFVKYMLSWRSMKLVKTIVIGQDPYRTDIFPEYASAFA